VQSGFYGTQGIRDKNDDVALPGKVPAKPVKTVAKAPVKTVQNMAVPVYRPSVYLMPQMVVYG
jgi:hypothetical protein